MLSAKEEHGLIILEIGGKLDSEDFDAFTPLFERIADRESGTVPMLIILKPDFSGWDLGGLWRDLKFDVRHKDQFGRIAIVGDKKWAKWATQFYDPLFRAKMRYFEIDVLAIAKSWARENLKGTNQ